MRVAIVGMGYVGLVTGACLAEKGHQVTCIELDEEKVRAVAGGKAPIYEEGIEGLLARNLGERFRATSDLSQAVGDAEVTMIAVGTPFDGTQIDLCAVRSAAQSVGEAIRGRDDFPDVPRIHTSVTAAETIKYASNALLATMISFSNEFADLCSAVGDVDVVDVMRGLHSSMYLTVDGERAPITSFLEAGCGYGGSCLPKDVKALIAHGALHGVPMQILQATDAVNARRPDEVVAILERHFSPLEGKAVTVLGLAFKPDTDDVRESPAVPIVQRLLAAGAAVRVHDPLVRSLPEALAGTPVELEPDLEAALGRTDAVVLVTRWRQYDDLPEVLARLDPQPLLVDGRRVIDPERVERYDGIGYPAGVATRPAPPGTES
jgi:UDP-glucose 6-dehydrogenase